MLTVLLWIAAHFGGLPISGPRLVVPLPPILAGPGACIEIGLQNGGLAVRLVRPARQSEPHLLDPDGDLGPHDFWAGY